MNTIQQTLYGLSTMLYTLADIQPTIPPMETVNERLNILPSARPNITERVKLNVLVIGNGGYGCVSGNAGRPKIRPHNHTATDAAPFEPMPFVLRPANDDLNASERTRFCLRKEIEIDGELYYAYYGMYLRLSKENFKVTKVEVSKVNGLMEEVEFVADSSNINPTPVDLPPNQAVVAADRSVKVTAPIEVVLDRTVVEEIIEASKILNGGDETSAVISEFALCTGATRLTSVSSSEGQVQFTESVATQVFSFASDLIALYFNKKEQSVTFDVGGMIPLISVESIPTITTIPTGP